MWQEHAPGFAVVASLPGRPCMSQSHGYLWSSTETWSTVVGNTGEQMTRQMCKLKGNSYDHGPHPTRPVQPDLVLSHRHSGSADGQGRKALSLLI